MDNNNSIIFGLSNSQALAASIAQITGIKLGEFSRTNFADGEILFRSEDPVRGRNIYLIQSTSKPVNDALMELFIAIDSLRRASAKYITVIIPYYGYARQDRKSDGREPITSRLVANLLETSGANRVLTLDIHSPQQQGFFTVPFDSLTAMWTLLEFLFEKTSLKPCCDVMVVSPDYGGVKRSREIAERLDMSLAIVDKRRPRPNEVEIENILGDVNGKHCIIPDDIIDTGGTMISVAKMLKANGAKSVNIIATHGLFNGNAIDKFNDAMEKKIIDNLLVTNSIENSIKPTNTKIVSIAELIASVIQVFETGVGSLSKIYNSYKHVTKKKK